MSSKDRTKLIVAIVILIVAGLLIAWNFGLFDSLGGGGSSSPPPQPAPTTPPSGGPQSTPPVG